MDVLRALADAGPERCRVNLPRAIGAQADALILALVELKERGTVEACTGFAAILTDAIGTRATEPQPELYEAMARAGAIRPYKLKRLVNRGHRIALPALWREQGESGPGTRQGTRPLTDAT